jgi:hypothetical protein
VSYLREIVMLSALLTAVFVLSVTVTVKLTVPVLVGVPEIVPVEAASVRPAGRVPEVIAQV